MYNIMHILEMHSLVFCCSCLRDIFSIPDLKGEIEYGMAVVVWHLLSSVAVACRQLTEADDISHGRVAYFIIL